MSTTRIAYGVDPFQFAELTLPATNQPHAVAIVIHGGFWRSKYDLDYIRPVCRELAQSGIAAWNLEYRRIGNHGGGWPGTFEDVAAGADHLAAIAERYKLDMNRVIAIGHSAGGHLAFWLAARKTLLAGAISLAGVVDLRRAWELQLSSTVVADFLGGAPDEVPDRYAFASPIERLPFGIPQRLFHGNADVNVPLEISERYVQTARACGDDAQLTVLQNCSHFDIVDPRTKVFAHVLAAATELTRTCERPPAAFS